MRRSGAGLRRPRLRREETGGSESPDRENAGEQEQRAVEASTVDHKPGEGRTAAGQQDVHRPNPADDAPPVIRSGQSTDARVAGRGYRSETQPQPDERDDRKCQVAGRPERNY